MTDQRATATAGGNTSEHDDYEPSRYSCGAAESFGVLDPLYWSGYGLDYLVGKPVAKALDMVDYVGQTFQNAVKMGRSASGRSTRSSASTTARARDVQPDLDETSDEGSEDDDNDDGNESVENCSVSRRSRSGGRRTARRSRDDDSSASRRQAQPSQTQVPTFTMSLDDSVHTASKRRKSKRTSSDNGRRASLSSNSESGSIASNGYCSEGESTLEGLNFVDDWSAHSSNEFAMGRPVSLGDGVAAVRR